MIDGTCARARYAPSPGSASARAFVVTRITSFHRPRGCAPKEMGGPPSGSAIVTCLPSGHARTRGAGSRGGTIFCRRKRGVDQGGKEGRRGAKLIIVHISAPLGGVGGVRQELHQRHHDANLMIE